MSRKLASVQTITALNPIKKADKIEVATVLGWRVVVRKGEFQVGDKCIFFEIDSILPPLECFNFLESSSYRLRTVTMRGQISQGLAMPISVINHFPELSTVPRYMNDPNDENCLVKTGGIYIRKDCVEDEESELIFKHTQIDFEDAGYCVEIEDGLDLTDILGITKYEEETKELEKGILGKPFPSEYVSHTDLERIQTRPELLDEMRGIDAYALQKIDGYSFTAVLRFENKLPFDLLICSSDQTLERMPESNTSNDYLDTADRLNIRQKMTDLYAYLLGQNMLDQKEEIIHSISIQCELAGIGIRKNRMGLSDKRLFLFNVAYVSDNMHYMNFKELCAASKILNIPMPELVWDGIFNFQSIEELLELSDQSKYSSGHRQEGIVFKPKVEMYSESLCGRLQFKVINNNYLLDIGE